MAEKNELPQGNSSWGSLRYGGGKEFSEMSKKVLQYSHVLLFSPCHEITNYSKH